MGLSVWAHVAIHPKFPEGSFCRSKESSHERAPTRQAAYYKERLSRLLEGKTEPPPDPGRAQTQFFLQRAGGQDEKSDRSSLGSELGWLRS